MRNHPGGEAHTRRMLALADLPPGASVLDLGAGAGEAVELLRSLGFDALGIDTEPRGDAVVQGDLLCSGLPDESFDAVLSQCAFFVSGDVPGALRESCRLLKKGGLLLWSDVFFEAPEPLLEKAGLSVLCTEDMTALWREYYIDLLWREDLSCCALPRGKCSYRLVIARKE